MTSSKTSPKIQRLPKDPPQVSVARSSVPYKPLQQPHMGMHSTF